MTNLRIRICTAAICLLGASCSSVPPAYPVTGRADIDIGGFEETGAVEWDDTYQAGAMAGQGGKGVYPAAAVEARPVAHYRFYRARTGLRVWFAPQKYVPLIVTDSVADQVVLDQASLRHGDVHVSGRQRSGAYPGLEYVEVMRATPVRHRARIAW